MPTDFKSFKKLESMPPSELAKSRRDDEELLVLVKLRRGAEVPSYLSPRARMGSEIFSAEIIASDLARLEADPAVESVSISQQLPLDR